MNSKPVGQMFREFCRKVNALACHRCLHTGEAHNGGELPRIGGPCRECDCPGFYVVLTDDQPQLAAIIRQSWDDSGWEPDNPPGGAAMDDMARIAASALLDSASISVAAGAVLDDMARGKKTGAGTAASSDAKTYAEAAQQHLNSVVEHAPTDQERATVGVGYALLSVHYRLQEITELIRGDRVPE